LCCREGEQGEKRKQLEKTVKKNRKKRKKVGEKTRKKIVGKLQ
jgi:hypothetical protein